MVDDFDVRIVRAGLIALLVAKLNAPPPSGRP